MATNMRGTNTPLLTDVNQTPSEAQGLPLEGLVMLLAPVMTVASIIAIAALAAAVMGLYRVEMLMVAAGLGGAVGAMALLLLYRRKVEHQLAARQLDEMRARVGGIVESAMDAIISIDEGQRIVQFNAAAEAMFRWPRAAVIGAPLSNLLPERFRGVHAGHVRNFAQTATTSRGMGNQTVLYGLRADGVEFPIEASISQHAQGGRKLFTVILRDVTHRLRNEERLAASEARLRGVLDSAMDAIITVDEDQHVVLFNAAAEKVFGCPRSEAIGAPLAWFIPQRFRDAHKAHMDRFAAGNETSRRMDAFRVVTGLRRNGEEFPIEASISQVAEGGKRLFTVILRDVTQRVRSEAELQASREELKQFAIASNSVREQEKRRIARELHDELGQTLTALKIDLGWLRERLGDEPEVGLKLASMQGLLDATVASARRIAADLRPLMLDDLGLAAACEWLVQNFRSRTGIECELDMQGDLDLADPHATAIFRALQESLTNVAKHAKARRVQAMLKRADGTISLVVRDNGTGFATTDPRRPDALGLMGLKERAYLLGGTFSLESAPGEGTRVELNIPEQPA